MGTTLPTGATARKTAVAGLSWRPELPHCNDKRRYQRRRTRKRPYGTLTARGNPAPRELRQWLLIQACLIPPQHHFPLSSPVYILTARTTPRTTQHHRLVPSDRQDQNGIVVPVRPRKTSTPPRQSSPRRLGRRKPGPRRERKFGFSPRFCLLWSSRPGYGSDPSSSALENGSFACAGGRAWGMIVVAWLAWATSRPSMQRAPGF